MRNLHRDFEVQNGGLFTGRGRPHIDLSEVALWRVLWLHILQFSIITCALFFDENFLGIINNLSGYLKHCYRGGTIKSVIFRFIVRALHNRKLEFLFS